MKVEAGVLGVMEGEEWGVKEVVGVPARACVVMCGM